METGIGLENKIYKILADLNKEFKQFYEIYEKELSSQKAVCRTALELVHRLGILKRRHDRLQEIIEGEMIAHINREVQKIHNSK